MKDKRLEIELNGNKYWCFWHDMELERLWKNSRFGTKEDLEEYENFLKEYNISKPK